MFARRRPRRRPVPLAGSWIARHPIRREEERHSGWWRRQPRCDACGNLSSVLMGGFNEYVRRSPSASRASDQPDWRDTSITPPAHGGTSLVPFSVGPPHHRLRPRTAKETARIATWVPRRATWSALTLPNGAAAEGAFSFGFLTAGATSEAAPTRPPRCGSGG